MNKVKVTIGTVCYIIDKKEDKILLLKRSNEPMKNLLTGVGGKTDFEEDIKASCIREIKEETGLVAKNVKLKGILKTILEGHNSSWILFVYSCINFSGNLIKCPEGELNWYSIDEISSLNLIGFTKEIMPYILDDTILFEGTIKHNSKGEVIENKISL